MKKAIYYASRIFVWLLLAIAAVAVCFFIAGCLTGNIDLSTDSFLLK